jgi:cell division septation protein DedD
MGENPRPGPRLVERLILVGVWLMSCAVVYGIGFYTGNRIQERVPASEDRVVRLPVTAQPPPEGQRAKQGDEFTFYESLVPGAHPDANDGKAKAPPAPDAKTANAKAQPPAKSAATASSAGPKQRFAAGTKPVTGAAAKPGAKTASAAKSGTRSGTATAARSGGTAMAKGSAPKRSAYTVEASPTRSRSEAEAMRATLARRGFDATVQAVPKDGTTWYRLRVGRYASAEQAEQAVRQVRDRGGVSRAYVASQ